jgi:hypothetical protein
MTDQGSNPTLADQAASAQVVEPRSIPPTAYVLQTIKLHDGVNGDDFQKFVLEELFPTVDTNPDGEPDQHFLLNGGSHDEYVWMSRLAYEIHHTPIPNWLLNRVESLVDDVQGKLEPFGARTASTTYYDVAGWRSRLGL